MKVIWSDESWKDFEYWLDNNQKIVKRIRKLIQNTRRTPFEGIGKPEPLKEIWRDYGLDGLLMNIDLYIL